MGTAEKTQKTNAMRLLERAKIVYRIYEYPHGKEALPGVEVAALLGRPPETVYKTLVTEGNNGYYVFVIPVAAELDLKLAARAAGVKNLSMMKVTDLFAVTGYVRGGCTSVGMKKTLSYSDRRKRAEVFYNAGERGQDRLADRAFALGSCGSLGCGVCTRHGVAAYGKSRTCLWAGVG